MSSTNCTNSHNAASFQRYAHRTTYCATWYKVGSTHLAPTWFQIGRNLTSKSLVSYWKWCFSQNNVLLQWFADFALILLLLSWRLVSFLISICIINLIIQLCIGYRNRTLRLARTAKSKNGESHWPNTRWWWRCSKYLQYIRIKIRLHYSVSWQIYIRYIHARWLHFCYYPLIYHFSFVYCSNRSNNECW